MIYYEHAIIIVDYADMITYSCTYSFSMIHVKALSFLYAEGQLYVIFLYIFRSPSYWS